MNQTRILWLLLAGLLPAGHGMAQGPATTDQPGRWSIERVNAWHDQIAWPVGANFLPSSAINQLEMWQAETFDPQTIDRELGWAAAIGMNTMRVFLHDLAWQQDHEGFGIIYLTQGTSTNKIDAQ